MLGFGRGLSGLSAMTGFWDEAASGLLLEDHFTDVNGTALDAHVMDTGPGWTISTGTWQIQSNRANDVASSGLFHKVTADAGQANVDAQVDVTLPPAAGNYYSGGLIARFSDGNNYWLVYVEYSGSAPYVFIDTVESGGDTVRSSGEVTASPGGTYTLRLVANGSTVNAYWDGDLICSYTSSFNNSATEFGLYSSYTGAYLPLLFDDFQAASVATPPPPPPPPTPPPAPPAPWKSGAQLITDFNLINSNYSRWGIFELKAIRDHPQSTYVQSLIRSYADAGTKLYVYVQNLTANATTLALAQTCGFSGVITYEDAILTLFRNAGMEVFWWANVCYPGVYDYGLSEYGGWPDLTQSSIRQTIANRVVSTANSKGTITGMVLDYIRWNTHGSPRTAAQVTDLVQKIRAQWNKRLEASVFSYIGAHDGSSGGGGAVCQLWDDWIAAGYYNYYSPMSYNSADLNWLVTTQWNTFPAGIMSPALSVKDY